MQTALEDTFKAWNQAGHLAGPEHYALRQALRIQARAADELEVAGKSAAAAQTAAVLQGQLSALRLPTVDADPFDDDLERLFAEASDAATD